MKNLILVGAMALAGCAAPKPQPPSAFEKDQAMQRYKECLKPVAAKYDDGKSDAKTVAQAMVGACPNEYQAGFDIYTKMDNEAVRNEFRHRRAEIQADIALRVVLEQRAASK